MEEEENILKYKFVQQIDIYKNNNYSNIKSINEDHFIENIKSNEIAYTTALLLLAGNHEYNVIFPKQTTYYESFNNSKIVIEDLRKLIINIKSIEKILKLANINESEILSYILFYHNIIDLETSSENKTIYNINFDTLMKIINYFHIQYKDKNIKIHKNSLKKIIGKCGLSYDEKFRYLNFYEVEEKTTKKYNHKNNKDLKGKSTNDNDNSISTDDNKNTDINKINEEDKINKENKIIEENRIIEDNKINEENKMIEEVIGNENNINNNDINKYDKNNKNDDKNNNNINKINNNGNNNNDDKNISNNSDNNNSGKKGKRKGIIKNKIKIKNNTNNEDEIKNESQSNNKNSGKNTSRNKIKKENITEFPLKEEIQRKNNDYINALKYNIYNYKPNKKLDFNRNDNDEEDIFEKSYDFLETQKIKNKYNENKKNNRINSIISLDNESNISKKDDLNKTEIKPCKRKTIKKIRKKSKKSFTQKKRKKNFEIFHSNSVTYLGDFSPNKKTNEIQTETELLYPFNGYTKYTTSFAIESPEKHKILKTKKDDDYCYFPFILRKTPELRNKIIYLCGSLSKLGNWNVFRAIKMDEENRNGEEFYSKYIEVEKNEIPFEYKYFYYDNGKIYWIGRPFENYLTFPQFFESLRALTKSHISIIDLNIRYINTIDGINIWDNRKESLIQLLLNRKADVFFFQEITRPQSEFIDRYLSSIYEFVGEYRDSTDASEKCSICVNKLKYTIIHSGQFWLSSTPYIPGSNDFGNFFPRICTWASLKQIEGISLLFMNVHLDHVNMGAHLPCVKVLIEEEKKIEERFKDIHFVFIAGCFYSEENDEDIKYIKNQGFTEILFENSFHGFTGLAYNHWDYMFWKEKNGNDIEFKEAYVMKKEGTIDESRKQYISDHFPIYAEFYLKNIK